VNYDYKHLLPNPDGSVTVKGYGTYAANSVLAGQVKICFIGRYARTADALADHPTATMSHAMIEPVNTFNHLGEDNDY
jgi:hypothetical protein